jgi:hypothetical protein
MRATQTASPDGSMDDLAASAVVSMRACFFARIRIVQLCFTSVCPQSLTFPHLPQISCLMNDTKRIKEGVAAIKMRLKTGHGKSRVLGTLHNLHLLCRASHARDAHPPPPRPSHPTRGSLHALLW